jgi:hypothetical protein
MDQDYVVDAVAASIWHKDIPLKVVLFVWRLFRDRLPTRSNLFRRNVIDIDAQSCVGGCGLVETSTHLFFHCNFFASVWNFILQWLGITSAFCQDVALHFAQFRSLGGVTRSSQSIL